MSFKGKAKGKRQPRNFKPPAAKAEARPTWPGVGNFPALLGYSWFMALDRITVDPNRMRGLPCIRDTRVTVSAVLGQLAASASIDEVLAEYPYVERDDIFAALEYAATGRWEGSSN